MQAGLLAGAQTAHQDRVEPIQTQLTEELESWRAEQQSREDLLKERIATLESELTRLRGELDQVRNQAHPSALMPTRNAPKEARRIVFRREQAQTARHVDKQDIILAVSRGLAQADFPSFVRANDAGYSSTWAVTVVLEKGALGSMLVPVHWGLVVAAAQQVDPAMRSAELPEQWYRAKGGSRTGNPDPTEERPQWLWRHRDVQGGTRKWPTIVVTVGSLEEARDLLVHGIRFGGARFKTEPSKLAGATHHAASSVQAHMKDTSTFVTYWTARPSPAPPANKRPRNSATVECLTQPRPGTAQLGAQPESNDGSAGSSSKPFGAAGLQPPKITRDRFASVYYWSG
ncbi:uncharacterized protein N7458_005007 [Penicillium daleae]|uniref:Uncharacterized protein n=1 Tax=Penicillium daleae TaxID=63821 RepID=A0AAD6C755_9EURO|nr:uncharacterized protein N7458_005007 [Penicillium daleae]KAJ5454051.1 hypothetical protein N7458_005007 [Penicillium daleae]